MYIILLSSLSGEETRVKCISHLFYPRDMRSRAKGARGGSHTYHATHAHALHARIKYTDGAAVAKRQKAITTRPEYGRVRSGCERSWERGMPLRAFRSRRHGRGAPFSLPLSLPPAPPRAEYAPRNAREKFVHSRTRMFDYRKKSGLPTIY